MRNKWYDSKDMKVLFKDDYEDWVEFNSFVDKDSMNGFTNKQRVILFCRYRLNGLHKCMSYEDISNKTGIPLREIKEFMKYMKTPQPNVCPVIKSEEDKYDD